MYIENKSGVVRPGTSAVIGRVTFSQTGRTLYYGGRTLLKVKGYKYNHVDAESGEEFWVSGAKKNGEDGLYGYRPVAIDEECREEYWREVRGRAGAVGRGVT
jgi:hypothetical protein